MPLSTKRTQIRLPPPFDADEQSSVQRVALRAITAFANAHAMTFLTRVFFHGRKPHTLRMTSPRSSRTEATMVFPEVGLRLAVLFPVLVVLAPSRCDLANPKLQEKSQHYQRESVISKKNAHTSSSVLLP